MREQIRPKIRHRVAGGERAEIHAQRENEWHKKRPCFSQLQDLAPKHIGKHHTNEIKILLQFKREVHQHTEGGLDDYSVRKLLGVGQEQHVSHTQVPLHMQLIKHQQIQA